MTKWLNNLKLRLSISDSVRDVILLEYLSIARENIWTQYYGKPLPIDESDPWATDTKTKQASIHLAVTYFSNPDIIQQGQNVVDERMLFKILGNRIKYY